MTTFQKIRCFIYELVEMCPFIRRTSHQRRVRQFNDTLWKHGVPTTPRLMSNEEALQRSKLIIEEALELIEALGCAVSVPTNVPVRTSNVEVQSIECSTDESLNSLAHISKECADLHVIVTGTEQRMGIDLAGIQRLVDENNLAKLSGKRNIVDGKLIKPANHPSPLSDIEKYLELQGYRN